MIGTERLHRRKARTCRLGNRCLRTARDHNVRFPALHHTERVADTVRPRRACRHDTGDRAVQTVVDGNLSCRHIGNHHWNEEGADALGTFVEKPLIGTMHGLDAADARTDIGADAVMILCVEVKPRRY